MSAPLWTPNRQRITHSQLNQFMVMLSERHQQLFHDYHQLHQWSVEHADLFWSDVWDYCNVIGIKGDTYTTSGRAKYGEQVRARDTEWFPHASLNYAENLLASATQHPTDSAIIFENEHGESVTYCWQALYQHVSSVQQWLLAQGVKQGDVVAGYLPHSPYAVIAMLATASLGAVWTSTSPDFGERSVFERLGQVRPKVLFCCNAYSFGHNVHSMAEKNSAILAELSSCQAVCEVTYIATHSTLAQTDVASLHRYHYIIWDALLLHYPPQPLGYVHVPFNAPLFILYSSGTTGKPKCITHCVGGTLLNHLKEHQLHCDIKPNDRVFYYTTCGWMMWNWQVSALASAACLVIYDGHPLLSTDTLWSLAERHQVTLFGTAAKYLESLEKSHFVPNKIFALNKLKTLCSTGSVLHPHQFDFVYRAIKNDLHLASISGGTDICGCFVLGNPISAVYQGECQGAALGMDVDVFDQDGHPCQQTRGELVCKNSFPNQPIGFWGDSGEQYHNAYWNKYNGAWHHGDDVCWTIHGGMTFFGRSDATLNPKGIRIGTAEIYREVNALKEVVDSVAVGLPHQGDEDIILFIQLSPNTVLDENLVTKITQRLKTNCSPHHAPASIHAISDIPRTKSGKIVELAVKKILQGQTIDNIGAIANPEVLEEIKAIYRKDNSLPFE
ncbi:acetoacetate--CoA ligase [Thaumasiovibrio sp. DFM-14]|uniref:acetoacetate--CoA ligase n=1 Tax=Thaumasiovibrio sp. DFM-14 TaxID=3384792 RepID=UPI0039A048AD